MKVAVTGGGTLGHIVPGIAVANKLKKHGCDVFWIGNTDSDEKSYVQKRGINFFSVSAGKLKRYFAFSNFIMPFLVIKGFFQARRILGQQKPDVLFSKGGFVSVPVSRAAFSLGIPVVTHESDSSCGLATRIIARYCDVVCLGDRRCSISTKAKVRYTGNPVRSDISGGNPQKFRRLHGICDGMPTVLVLGGSQGALKLNNAIIDGMDRLRGRCNVILQSGKGKTTKTVISGLWQFESFDDDFKDVLSLADLVVSRAGAGAIAELQFLAKPMLLVPLGLDASRGDQITNAEEALRKGKAVVVTDYDKVIEKILELIDNEEKRELLYMACKADQGMDSAEEIAQNVMEVATDGSECS
ncbi:MAG: UDP-N-acetylglucosamine--N-acetylmuramyl-(pentapeptide) pyrophosphoryl-undecaprenol N-acetylglucosamine transferase [Sphaerochaetaceae bacterium]|jgi:UDP-N-acetylglucosamine--N-acetylmuramyl-(pentapeptide) pyrophosphoryl-undecaprenol N-acetylglucosamine transferase|nr:UDP-N-acetylglucosamine--N-acetylmuramyl-(pentapeptide) pyrophosphoryl-undecaprenol N-acetylglucosamine transferase [Sphaerochaetaceae bacterium]